MKIFENRYNGATVDVTSLPNTVDEFEKELHKLLASENKWELFWVKVPIEKSEFIPVLTQKGFKFHHTNEKSLMLVKKLKENAIIPTPKNYTVGVGAIVRRENTLLVVKDKFTNGYKLPGGHIDKKESIKNALQREVFEETGIQIELESISNLGHFTEGQFGESVMYVVCTAKAKTTDITIYDASEIIEARWLDIDEFLQAEDTNLYNRSVVLAAIENRELKLTHHPMRLRVSGSEVFY